MIILMYLLKLVLKFAFFLSSKYIDTPTMQAACILGLSVRKMSSH